MQNRSNTQPQGTSTYIRKITAIGMLSAISFILMFLDVSIPMLIPGFVKLDISDLPALIGSFSLGPVSGIAICLVKNLLHLMRTSTGGVGELSNFILSATFVTIAGIIYKIKKGRKAALIGSILGAVAMAIISVFSNYYFVYPVYTHFLPLDKILEEYKAINPNVKDLWDCLIWFNMPFTFFKAMLSVVLTFLLYKKISPIIKGTGNM